MSVVHHCPIGPSEQDRLMSVVVHLLAGGAGEVSVTLWQVNISSVSPQSLLGCWPAHTSLHMKDFKLSSILARLAEPPKGCEKSKFWKSQLRKSSLSDGERVSSVLMCSNFQDAQFLNGLILQKVKTLKTVENIYIKDSSPPVRSLVVEDDTYSEVFDSLSPTSDRPPPLPSRRSCPAAPARPPYPPHMRRSSRPRTVWSDSLASPTSPL